MGTPHRRPRTVRNLTVAKSTETIEKKRLAIQAEVDRKKTQTERNRLGQFATPTALAVDILQYAAPLLSEEEKIRFLDPAIGTGSFYSAFRKVFPKKRIGEALGFEIDPLYGEPASALWSDSGLAIKLADFTREPPSPTFNLVICNPPYVRHHHLRNGDKARLQFLTQHAAGMKLSGLAGLYCHFLGLSHSWMAQGCIAAWLIPSEFMDVNYGQDVKRYFLNRVTLLHIHRFDPNDVQFADALVSSAVVWFKNAPPPPNHEVKFSFGGTLTKPHVTRHVPAHVLAHESKWTRFPASDVRDHSDLPTLSDFFQIRRGLATGGNSYFILTENEIAARELPIALFTPILPSPRHLPHNEVKARRDGTPDIERRLFLLDTKLAEGEIRDRFPALATYLDECKAKGLHERYLCKHRSPWYAQENRPPAPIVCTYLGRGDAKSGRPFRFIFNGSRATVANVYLALYPTNTLARELDRNPDLLRKIWIALNQLPSSMLLGEGRVYGGGLHKLEPRELSNVPATFIRDLLQQACIQKQEDEIELFAET